jgi:hypothetical protein
MRTGSRTFALLITLGLLSTACEREDPVSPPSTPEPSGPLSTLVTSVPDVCGSETVALLADQTLDVGEVTISNDDEYLYVSLRTTGGWSLTETHVAVTSDPSALPKRGKRLVPGQFPEKTVHDPPVTVAHYAVPLPSGEDVVYVAAHADVVNDDRTEGAWGEGENRDGGGWASYTAYSVASCEPSDEPDVIGPGGGQIETDQAILDIPPGALTTDVEITVEPVDDSQLPDGVLPGTALDLGPDGQEFDEPVTLTIEYDDTGLSAEEEAELSIHLLQDDGTLLMVETTVDTDANLATAQLTHFSTYAVALPKNHLELRVGQLGVPWYSNGSVWEGFPLRHVVLVWNDGSQPVPGSDVTVEFWAEGLVEPFGLAYSTGLCDLETPTATSYHFTCSMANVINPGTAGTLSFAFTPEVGSAPTTFEVSAAFTVHPWTASTGTVSTNVVVPPDEADLDVFMDVQPGEVSVGGSLAVNVLVANLGPGPIDAATAQLAVFGDVAVDVLPVDCALGGDLLLVGLEDHFPVAELGDPVILTCPIPGLVPGFAQPINTSITLLSTDGLGEEDGLFIAAGAIDIEGATDPNPDNNLVGFNALVIDP